MAAPRLEDDLIHGPERWEEHVATNDPIAPQVSDASGDDSDVLQTARYQRTTAAKLLRCSLDPSSSEVQRSDEIFATLQQERRRKMPQMAEKRKFMAEHFNWLDAPEQDSLASSYTPFLDLPCSSFDFGWGGKSATCNAGGELLQMTSPSPICGFLSVRGDFQDSLDSLLARVQRHSIGKASFGLKVADPPDDSDQYCRLGRMTARGCFNYRWPMNRYELRRGQDVVGSCSIFSCLKGRNSALYQVMRLHMSTPKGYGTATGVPIKVLVTAGGRMRFSCLCGGLRRGEHKVEWDAANQVRRLRLDGETDMSGHTLSMKVYVNGLCQDMDTTVDPDLESSNPGLGKKPNPKPAHDLFNNTQYGDTEFRMERTLVPDAPVIIILKYRFEKDSRTPETGPQESRRDGDQHKAPMGMSKDFHSLAGLTLQSTPDSSGNISMMWRQIHGKAAAAHKKAAKPEVFMMARCLERILAVNFTQTRVRGKTYVGLFCNPISSKSRMSFQEIFWKIRFLVKAYDALSPSTIESQDMPETSKEAFEKNAKQYQTRIKQHLSWTLKALVYCLDEDPATATSTRFEVSARKPNKVGAFPEKNGQASSLSLSHDGVLPSYSGCVTSLQPRSVDKQTGNETPRSSGTPKREPIRRSTTVFGRQRLHIPEEHKNPDTDDSDWYHVLPSLWYVIKHHSELLYDDFRKDLVGRISKLVPAPPDQDGVSCNILKSTILQWYHYDCAVKTIIWLTGKWGPHFKTPHYAAKDAGTDPMEQTGEIAPDAEESQNLAAKIEMLVNLFDEMDLYKSAATRSIVLRASTRQPYTTADEQCDRLIFVASELGISDHDICVRHARARIKGRLKTATVNSGDMPPDFESIFPVPKSSPWELHALCHHSRLLIRDELDDDKTAETMKRCLEFLSAEATVIPTWQRSTTTSLAGWFSIEATCVFSSTALDIAHQRRNRRNTQVGLGRKRSDNGDDGTQTSEGTQTETDPADYDMIRPSMTGSRHRHKSSLSSLAELSHPRLQRFQNEIAPTDDSKTISDIDSFDNSSEAWASMSDKLSDILDAVRQMKTGEYFNWKAYQPWKRYHPDSFYNSLDDSPNLYTESRIRRIEPRQTLREYLSRDWPSGQPPGWTMKDLKLLKDIPPDQTRYLSVIDIKHPAFFREGCSSMEGNPVVVGRLDYQRPLSGIRNNATGGVESSSTNFFDSITRGQMYKEQVALSFYDALLDGSLTQCEDFARLPADLKQRFAQLPEIWRDRIGGVDVAALRVTLQRNVMTVLCDSLVDQQVQFRILFLQRCSRPLVQGFIYMWHTEALDMFDRHLGNWCHFSSLYNRSSWVTSITILYWSLKPRPTDGSKTAPSIQDQCKMMLEQMENDKSSREGSPMSDVFDENRDTAVFPPDRLGHKASKTEGKLSVVDDLSTGRYIKGDHCVEERATSVLLSTNGLGDLGRCSVVSRVISEEVMLESSRSSVAVWNAFINQPQTARCVIFLILLGDTCDALSNQYQAILDTLNNESLGLNTGVRRSHVLQDTFNWTDSKAVLVKLRRSLWTLTVLQVFVGTMKESLQRISEAKTEMKAQINGGSGRRHEVLEQMCQGYIEEFEKRYARFEAMSVKYDHSIDHITRFRDGISNISSLEDGRTSLRQDGNIWILTWITIIYLPISLTTALFAIPNEQEVIHPKMKLSWYLIVIIILFLFTVGLALSMLWWKNTNPRIRDICVSVGGLFKGKGERARPGLV